MSTRTPLPTLIHQDPAASSSSSSTSSAVHGTRAAPHPHVFVRWFVQYNPFFTASALCVLGGVLLVQRTFEGAGGSAPDAVVPLAVVVELYQALVIGTAALLYRRLCEHRPGVILGLIAVVFLFDPTLQGSALASDETPAIAFIGWMLFLAKMSAIVWAFCLRMNVSARVLAVGVGALIALLPQLRVTEWASHAGSVFAGGLLVLGAIATFAPPQFKSTRALGEVGAVMFPRLQRAVLAIAAGGLLLQGTNAVLAEGARGFGAVCAVIAMLAVAQLRSERVVWTAAFALGVMTLMVESRGGAALPLVGVTLLLAAPRFAPRVGAAGIFALAAPSMLMSMDDLRNVVSVNVVVVATLALLAYGLVRRAPSAALAIGALHAAFVVEVAGPALSATRDSWGVVLVAAGFAFVPLGLVVHRRLSAILAKDAAASVVVDDVDAPSSPAAVPTF